MNFRPRILYIADAYLQSLFAATPIGIARALKKLGARIEPAFLSADGKEVLHDFENAHFIRCGIRSYRASAIVGIKVVLLLLRRWKNYDFVIAEPNATLALAPFSMLRRFFPRLPVMVMDVRTQPVEVSSNYKGQIAEFKFDLALKIAARFFDGMLVITKEMEHYVLSKTGPIPYPVGVWTSGTSLELFKPGSHHDPVGKFQGRFVLMYHGQLSADRGLDNILYAVNAVRRDYPHVLAFLIGSGAMKERLIAIVRALGLNNHAIIQDPVPHDEIPRYINSADVGILAFPDHKWWRVQSPIKLFEYFAMKTPVIATDIPMNRSVIGTHNCAFIIGDNSPEQIAEGIRAAIRYRERLPEMGNVGRKLVESEYTWDRQAEKVLAYLQALSRGSLGGLK